MRLLEKHIAFVKDQAFLQDKLAARYGDNEWRSAKHRHSAAQFRVLVADLETAQSEIDLKGEHGPERSVVSSGILMRPEDLDNLPPELLEELNLSDADKLECEILEIIRNAGGVLSLNKIIIGLYRKTGTIHKRAALTSRLHRMVGRKRLHTVQDRRGIFSIKPLGDDETKGIPADQDDDVATDISGRANSDFSENRNLVRDIPTYLPKM